MKAPAKKPQDALRARALKRPHEDLVAAVEAMAALPDDALAELFDGVGTKAPDKDDAVGCPTLTRSVYFTGRNGPEQAWLDQALLRLAPRVADRIAAAKALTELDALRVDGGVSRPGIDASLDWLSSYPRLERVGFATMIPHRFDSAAAHTRLREVTLHDCVLDDVDGLRACPSIDTLRILHAHVKIPKFSAWPTLRKLVVHRGVPLFADDALAGLSSLEELHLTRLDGTSGVVFAKLGVSATITSLDLSYSTLTNGLVGVDRCTALRALDISRNPAPSLEPLRDHPSLVTLNGHSAYSVQDIAPLASVKTLRELRLANSGVQDLSPLSGRAIEVLDVTNTAVTALDPLKGNAALREFSISAERGVGSLEPLADCVALESLQMVHTDNPFYRVPLIALAKMVDLGWMKRLTRLRSARIVGPGLERLDGVEGCKALRSLEIVRASKVTDLTPLSGLTELERLAITDSAITSVAALTPLTRLVALDLRDNKSLTDGAPIWGMTWLRRVALHGTGVRPEPGDKEWRHRVTVAREPDMERAFEPETEAKPRVVLGPKGQGAAVRKQFSVIRAQLNSKDLEQIEQGAELLAALDDPSLFDEMIDGATFFDDVPANRKAIVQGGFTPPPTLGTTRTANAFQTAAILAVISRAPEGATKAIALRDAVRQLSFGEQSKWGNAGPFDMGPLARMPNLTRLAVCRPTELRNADALRGHKQLTELAIDGSRHDVALDLSGCTSLRSLSLSGLLELKKLDVTGCTALRSFELSLTNVATALVGAEDLIGLRNLTLTGPTVARWLSALPTRALIESLTIKRAPLSALEDVLAKCAGLRALSFETCQAELDFACLASAKRLSRITFKQMHQQKKLDGLAKIASLTEIRLPYSKLDLPEAVMPLWKR